MSRRCLQRLRCLGLVLGLLCPLAGCGSNSGSNNTSGAVSRGRPLALQVQLLSELSPQAVSMARHQALASAQMRQVGPGDPGFIEQFEVRLQSQGSDLAPPQVFTLDATEQETATRDVIVPDTAPATFQVLVSAFNPQGIEVFRGSTSVGRDQTSAMVPMLRAALVPVPATPANLQQTTFAFADGAIFGLVNIPVTLATGTFVDNGNVGDFALTANGLVASGSVVVGSCTFLVTTSTFPAGQGLQVSDQIILDPCQVDAIDGRLIVTNAGVSSTPTISSPPLVIPPDTTLNLPTPPTLVIAEDTSGSLQITASVSGARPGSIAMGITIPPAHGTATLTNTGVVTYKPTAHFNGSDRLVVTVVASFTDNNAPALLLGTLPVSITVRPVNDSPVVANPENQTTLEGTAVSLPIVAQDADGDQLTFSATGLPPGLSIHPTTGVISGAIAVGAASGSPYSVTVTVTDGTANTSIMFPWLITPGNRPPTLNNPGNQATSEGTAVTLGLQGNDPDGNPLVFNATNLPPGLNLNTTTGIISGTVALRAAAGSPYSVTATVSDGFVSASQTFIWTVNPLPSPMLSALSTSSGPVSGGTVVIFAGTGFQMGATLTIGGMAATNVSVLSSTQLTATTPAGSAGTQAVVVTNPDGQSATLPGGFLYTSAFILDRSTLDDDSQRLQ